MNDEERSAVRHLNAIIREMDATLRAVKVEATKGLQPPTALDCPGQVEWTRKALAEIDRIVL